MGLTVLAARALEPRLFGVHGADVPTLLISVAILKGAAVLATWVPASRAVRLDPMEAFRTD